MYFSPFSSLFNIPPIIRCDFIMKSNSFFHNPFNMCEKEVATCVILRRFYHQSAERTDNNFVLVNYFQYFQEYIPISHDGTNKLARRINESRIDILMFRDRHLNSIARI